MVGRAQFVEVGPVPAGGTHVGDQRHEVELIVLRVAADVGLEMLERHRIERHAIGGPLVRVVFFALHGGTRRAENEQTAHHGEDEQRGNHVRPVEGFVAGARTERANGHVARLRNVFAARAALRHVRRCMSGRRPHRCPAGGADQFFRRPLEGVAAVGTFAALAGTHRQERTLAARRQAQGGAAPLRGELDAGRQGAELRLFRRFSGGFGVRLRHA